MHQLGAHELAASSGSARDDALMVDGEGPRWEWRSFDCKPRLWEDATQGAVKSPVVLTAETYLVTRESPVSVKVRDERVEVRELLQTDAAGLECWQVTRTFGFPLVGTAMAELCGFWGVPPQATRPAMECAEDLLSFVGRCTPEVRIVPIRKWRRAFRLEECTGERVTLLVAGTLLESLAIEHRDPRVLFRTLTALHLVGERETNYLRAVKQALGWTDRDAR